MNAFNLSDEEKKQILKKHKEATKNFYRKKAEDKEGLKKVKKDEKDKE